MLQRARPLQGSTRDAMMVDLCLPRRAVIRGQGSLILGHPIKDMTITTAAYIKVKEHQEVAKAGALRRLIEAQPALGKTLPTLVSAPPERQGMRACVEF